MKRKISAVMFFLIFLLINTSAKGQDWLSKIHPFETDVSTVIKLLGHNYEKKGQDEIFYKLKEGNVSIDFSPEKCADTGWGKWNIPPNVVVGMTFYPRNKKRKPSFYDLPKENMEHLYDSGEQVFRNNYTGLYYSTYRGKVSSIRYYPGKKYDSLKCSDTN